MLTNSKHSSESNLLRSENFEESLEDIEAEAEICSPTKSIIRSDSKQKKKSRNGLFYNLLILIMFMFYVYFLLILKGKNYLDYEDDQKRKEVRQKIMIAKKNY